MEMIKELGQEKRRITRPRDVPKPAPSVRKVLHAFGNCKMGILEDARRSTKKGDQKLQDGCARVGGRRCGTRPGLYRVWKRKDLKAGSSCTWKELVGLEALANRWCSRSSGRDTGRGRKTEGTTSGKVVQNAKSPAWTSRRPSMWWDRRMLRQDTHP